MLYPFRLALYWLLAVCLCFSLSVRADLPQEPDFPEHGPILPAVVPFSQMHGPLVDIDPVPSIVPDWNLNLFPIPNFDQQSETPVAETEPESEELAQEAVPATRSLPEIAIIIDDVGYNRRGMEASLALPNEVALAILPHTPFAGKTVKAAEGSGRILMLHAPMENERALKLGPGGLYAAMDEDTFKKVLVDDLRSIPGVKGVNNHMGSLLTKNKVAMAWVMEILKQQGLFFIDSLTSPDSVAMQTAEQYQLSTSRRDVFLDHVQNEQAIDRQFQRLLDIARKTGRALAIGHPYPETMSYLRTRLKKLEQDGVKLVPITRMLSVSPYQSEMK